MDGDEPMILDVNVNCDLDATSVVMRSAAISRLTYTDVIGRILNGATLRMGVREVRRVRAPRAAQTEMAIAAA